MKLSLTSDNLKRILLLLSLLLQCQFVGASDQPCTYDASNYSYGDQQKRWCFQGGLSGGKQFGQGPVIVKIVRLESKICPPNETGCVTKTRHGCLSKIR